MLYERRNSMKKDKTSLKILNALVKYSVKNSANCTTSGAIYQPKAPKALKKFSKIENDK